MTNFLISTFFTICLLFQIDTDYNETPANKEIERIDNCDFTDTIFHTVDAQNYTMSDFHCNLYYLDTNLLKINVFGIYPHLLYIRSYYFENTNIFAVTESSVNYKNYSFLDGKNVQELSLEEITALASFESLKSTNYYYENDSLVSLSGTDTFLLEQPRMMYSNADDFLIYYHRNLEKVHLGRN